MKRSARFMIWNTIPSVVLVPRFRTRSVALLAMVLLTSFARQGLAQDSTATQLDYGQQIQPILAKHCYACHGPDEEAREADLRLDVEEAAKEYAIVPGDSAASVLVERIFSDDEDLVMPPRDTGHVLSPEDKNAIRAWVDQGAKWQLHWAFQPIDAPEVPAADPNWGANTIDRFVLAKLKEKKLAPSQPASKTTLIRRVYFDLIGLPPTPEQVQAFVNDHRADAFERVVDELLKSRHYGEQMAASWLDVARFADTNGYQNDFVRTMWPYRDWVINAFNENLPYDQFIVQQIAGDLLPNATKPQRIATGFNRNNRTVTEAGSIPEEWRIENCVDRVETTATAFLGLTIGCGRCHDHKYDPVTQTEFYEFFAFFNNVDELGVYQETRGNVGPQEKVPTPDEIDRLDKLDREIASLEAAVAEHAATSSAQSIAAWRASLETPQPAALPEAVFEFSPPASDDRRGQGPAGASTTLKGTADQVDVVADLPFALARDKPFSWSVWLTGDSRGAIFGKMNEEESYRGVDGLILPDGRLKVHLIHAWNDNAIAVTTREPLPKDRWTCVTVTYDGSSRANGIHVYFNGVSVELGTDVDSLDKSIESNVPFRIGQRSKSEFFRGTLSAFRMYDQQLTADQVQQLHRQMIVKRYDELAKADGADEPLGVIQQYLVQQQEDSIGKRLADLKAKRDELLASQTTTMVMKEREGAYRETYLLRRGQYNLPDTTTVLMPAVPAVLPPLTADQPQNRLGLAQWLVDDRNPLVARVTVNRAWMKFFDRGLVASADNLGIQGTPPTHPKLLDWLADDFRRHGWDLKRLHKQIVMSATYQQSSDFTPELLDRDPENQWLARGTRARLSAEQLRDQALAISGLLVLRVGGPSVFPYQPDGLWDELAGGANNGPYKLSTGDDLYRRSLYTYRKRTVSHPTLATFDAPTWEICQAKRAITNTPLQSLALLNDVTYVEASRKLAERMMMHREDGSSSGVSDAIMYGFMLAAQRAPTDRELKTLTAGYDHYLAYYREHPAEAEQLLATGEADVHEALPTDQLAAMTSVASILLNLDEVVTKF